MAHILDQKTNTFKLLKIPEFKKMSKTDSDRSWKVLEDAISQMLTLNMKCLRFEQIYRTTYNMVLYRCGEVVYRGFVSIMTRHLQGIATTLEAVPGCLFLEELNRQWTSYIQSLQFIEDVFLYVDRAYFRPVAKTSTCLMGMQFWQEHLITTPIMRDRLVPALWNIVLHERMGEEKVRGLMSNIIKMLEDLGLDVYADIFQKPLLDATAAVYKFQSDMYPHEPDDCSEYLNMAQRTLNEETQRMAMCMEIRTGSKVTEMLNKLEMICNYMLRLVDRVMPDLALMLVEDKYDDLARAYLFFQLVPGGLAILCTAMSTQLRATWKNLVTDPERLENQVDFVRRLLGQKDKYDKLIRLSFKNDITFQNAFSAAMETFVNSTKRAAELISLYMDDKLWKAADLKEVSTTDVEGILDKVMRLIPYLHDKDVLKKNYRADLARRLLFGRAVSHYVERIQISKLKAEFGYPFTSKLERMLTDMQISKDTMEGFTLSLLSGCDSATESILSVFVLTSASWPTQPPETCNLPREVLSMQHKFQIYYYSTHFGRHLNWSQPNLSSAELKADFGFGKEHELCVSTYQMCILMLFNTKDRLTYKEVQQTTGIRSLILMRELHSLACVEGKKVLRKEPMSNNIAKADVFIFNDRFSSKLHKIKIWNVGAQKLMENERIYTRERVVADRRPQIEAAIVRVMKSRQILDYKTLVAQVTQHLKSRFVPNPPEIKNRIEALIDKEFLERDRDDRQLYRYLA